VRITRTLEVVQKPKRRAAELEALVERLAATKEE